MTATERPFSELLRHAARRVREDGHFELRTAVDGAPPRPVDVGPIADFLAAAVSNFAPYEGRGWEETKILKRVSDTDRAALMLAWAIVDPERFRRNHIQ